MFDREYCSKGHNIVRMISKMQVGEVMHRKYDMDQKEEEGLFCQFDSSLVISEDEFCCARKDGFPVTELHNLIIPK